MAFQGDNRRAVAEARVLKDKLSFRLASASLTVTSSVDSLGNPVLTISGGAWSTGNQFALIQIVMQPSLNVDALGLTQTVYTPEIMNIGVEGNTAGSGSPFPATSDFNSVLSFANELAIMGEVLGFGTKVQIWNSGHGVQPSISAGVMQGTLVASFDDLYNPLTSTM